MYWWQEKDEPKPIKIKVPAGHYYAKGFADAYNGRISKAPRGKRAREAYDKGYATGQAAKKQPASRQ